MTNSTQRVVMRSAWRLIAHRAKEILADPAADGWAGDDPFLLNAFYDITKIDALYDAASDCSPCECCGGTGRVERVSGHGPAAMLVDRPCPECN